MLVSKIGRLKREMELDSTFHWSTSSELVLFQVLARHKPAGINKHFSMAIVVEELVSQLTQADRQVTSDDVWAKLRTMYDLAAVDDREERIPFPLDEREFCLPRRDFSILISDKQREIARDRKEGRVTGKGGVLRMTTDMGSEGTTRRESRQQGDAMRESRLQMETLKATPRPGEKEGRREPGDNTKEGNKRHTTRSTPSTGSVTPAKRRTIK